ncbi:MAG: glycine cleavage T C-terminal barrel domain-containing protein [Pseudomonadota bacterium]
MNSSSLATSTEEYPLQALWRVPAAKDPDRCAKQFVDFQNDTSVADIRLAVREGYRNVEHVKRYTALGFGTDQGKLGNINGMAVLAECLGEDIPAVGTTTFRPAYTPVSFGVGAGENTGALLDPVRKTAIHECHELAGAPMEVVGQWHRPWYFPRPGEDLDAAVRRECLAVRNGVGMMDASTLGKIDARGPDVVDFLERIYTHNIGKMRVGRCAYGVMLGEDGMLMDDGVMARLGEQSFYLTTTTGGAAHVLSWLELWLQTEWPELEVYLTSLTDQYSTIAVAGPDSRKVLEKVGCSVELDKEEFPFMTVRDAELGGISVQLFRVSFSGELAFEVNVDSRFAADMWRRIASAGEEFGITPYGTETMHVLRAEKGFVIVGQDTDGSVTPVDLRMNWMLSKDKDFLGKRSLARPDCVRTDRKQLVGLLSEDGETVLPEGAQIVEDPNAPLPVPMCGLVTSSYFSPILEKPIALALVAAGHQRKDETVFAALQDGSSVPVKISSPVFYDAKGDRQNV